MVEMQREGHNKNILNKQLTRQQVNNCQMYTYIIKNIIVSLKKNSNTHIYIHYTYMKMYVYVYNHL